MKRVMPEWKSDPSWLHEEFMERLRMHNLACIHIGVEQGWWEGVTDNGDPIPHPQKMSIEEHPTIAHVVVALKIFPSITQARKNGFVQDSTPGLHVFTKRKIRVILE